MGQEATRPRQRIEAMRQDLWEVYARAGALLRELREHDDHHEWATALELVRGELMTLIVERINYDILRLQDTLEGMPEGEPTPDRNRGR